MRWNRGSCLVAGNRRERWWVGGAIARRGWARTVAVMTIHTIMGSGGLPTRGVSPAAAALAAREYGVSDADASAAAANMAAGSALLLVISGKLASGKDTVAPAVMDAVGAFNREHHYYSRALKDELDQIIALIRTWHDQQRPAAMTGRLRGVLAEHIGREMHMPARQALEFFAGSLTNQVLAVRTVHARSRTSVIRRALQVLGTDVRRAQDEDYWVKKTVQAAWSTLAAGTSVYFTDVRFPNEVRGPSAMGAFAVRLDVSEATQRERLASRDGLVPDAAALTHVSETAMDDYDAFDLRVDNNGSLERAVELIVATLRGSLAAAA